MKSSSGTIRVIVVDDEPLAREGIRQLLEAFPDITVAGEAQDGVHAVELIRSKKPDLVFLDIQMPEIDGFGVVKEVGAMNMPLVIFVTAFDEFALRVFEINALDYLLKPVDPDRFAEAVGRAKLELERKNSLEIGKKLERLLEGLSTAGRFMQRIAVKSAGKVSFLNVSDVDWIQANGDYVWIHAQGKKTILREKMAGLEAKLDPQNFARIHRSTIVNINRIKDLEPLFYGDYSVNLADGTKLTLSRSHKEKLFAVMNLDR